MRISYFNYVYDIEGISAGAAIKGRELCGALERQGARVTINWRTPQPDSTVSIHAVTEAKTFRNFVSRYVREPRKMMRNFPNFFQECAITERQKPEVLFNRLEHYYFSAAIMCRVKNIPMVVEVDCPPTYENNTFYGKHLLHIPKLPSWAELYNLRTADNVVVISNILKDYYVKQGIPEEKMHVVPNGVDGKKFRPKAKSPDVMKKYGIGKDDVVIGWVGSLAGWAGIDSLVSMARDVMQNRPNVRFLLVGGGDNKAYFEKELRQQGFADRVFLPGWVDHAGVPDYLSAMDIVLAPYPKLDFWYASSMKIFEYMAVGKAIVATDVGQIGEVIRHGVNGMLFDADKPEGLTRSVLELVDSKDLRLELSNNARKDVETIWDWDIHGRKLIEIFENAISKHRNGGR